MIKSFKELIVWQKAMSLAEEIYRVAKKLPKEETFALGDQLRRASAAIPSNIAEGFGRRTKRDYASFLMIARGSLFETETQLLLCVRVRYLNESDIKPALAMLDEVGKMLNSVIAKLRSASPQPLTPNP